PADLVDLARQLDAATRIPAVANQEGARVLRSVSARKREQLPALLAAVEGMATAAARIVDVGAGSGHFAGLAAARFGRATRGCARAPARGAGAGGANGGLAGYVTRDACREPLALAADDLAVGLHACGALGDRLVMDAAASGADVALVSCCFQKITGGERLS